MKRILVFNTGGFANINSFYEHLSRLAEKPENAGMQFFGVHGCLETLNHTPLKKLFEEGIVTLLEPGMFGDGHDQAVRPGSIYGMQNSGKKVIEYPHEFALFKENLGFFDGLLPIEGDGSIKGFEITRSFFGDFSDRFPNLLTQPIKTAVKTIDGCRTVDDMPLGFPSSIEYVAAIGNKYHAQEQAERGTVLVTMGRDTGYLAFNAAEQVNELFGLILSGMNYSLKSFVSALLVQRHLGERRGFTVIASEGANIPGLTLDKKEDGTTICDPDALAKMLADNLHDNMQQFKILRPYGVRKTNLGNVQQTPPISENDDNNAKALAERIIGDFRTEFADTTPLENRNTPRHLVYLPTVHGIETLSPGEFVEAMEATNKSGGTYPIERIAAMRAKGVCFGDLPPLATAYLAGDPAFKNILEQNYPDTNLPLIAELYTTGALIDTIPTYSLEIDEHWLENAQDLLNRYRPAAIVAIPECNRGSITRTLAAVEIN